MLVPAAALPERMRAVAGRFRRPCLARADDRGDVFTIGERSTEETFAVAFA